MKKRIPAMILMFAMFLTTSYAANVYKKTIEVTSGINVNFNSQALDMTDANGKPVEAFIYRGTTYVPLRAVSGAFGADISYDSSTHTVDFYDDFTELVTAAYKLNRTINVCKGELELYNSAINANSFEINPTLKKQDSQKFIDRDADMLNTLSKDNLNYSLLQDDLLPSYYEFIKQYQLAVMNYTVMYTLKDYSNTKAWGEYFKSESNASLEGTSYGVALETFYDSFNWRTFTVD